MLVVVDTYTGFRSAIPVCESDSKEPEASGPGGESLHLFCEDLSIPVPDELRLESRYGKEPR